MSKLSGRRSTRVRQANNQHNLYRLVLAMLQQHAPRMLEIAKQRDALTDDAQTMGG